MIKKWMSCSLLFLLFFGGVKNVLCQQAELKPLPEIKISFVIVINGDAAEHLWLKFISYNRGLPIDTMEGTYIPGRIEYDRSEYYRFFGSEYDSIMIEFDSYQQLTKIFNSYPYRYRFRYFQTDFNADYQVYTIERMCIRVYREKYFKKYRKYKGGYVIKYELGGTSIPDYSYIKHKDD